VSFSVCAAERRFRALAAYGFFCAALAFFLYAVRLGWNESLVEDQGFRQTQTAISAYYMVNQPPRLAYETPVLGPPWSVPFEFPLYQWLVAGAVTVFHTPLDQTGRLVSIAFFLLTLIPADAVLRHLRVGRKQRLIVLSLMLLSPYYIYWSRAFLIESTAVFWNTTYLALAMRALKRPGIVSGNAAMLAGSLGSVVKITTFIPYLLALALYGAFVVWESSRQNRSWYGLVRRGAQLVALAAVPLAVAVCWTHFADARKALNPTADWTASTLLTTWNFGQWQERLSLGRWRIIISRYDLIAGSLLFLLLCLLGLRSRRRRWQIAGALVLAASGPLIFMNLYVHHEYYAYANGLFLIAALGIGCVALWEQQSWLRPLAPIALAALVTVGMVRYYQYFYPKQTARGTGPWLQAVTDAVAEQTHPDEVIVVLGHDWSSEIPYYSKRRALMIPYRRMAEFLCEPKKYLSALEDYRVGALVLFEPPRIGLSPQTLQEIIEVTGLSSSCRFVHGHLVAIYSRSGRDSGEVAATSGRSD
jgi:hypothetical protein